MNHGLKVNGNVLEITLPDGIEIQKVVVNGKVFGSNHWIPCSERLPKRDDEYLVTYEKGYAEDYGLDLVGIAPYEVDCEGFGIWQEKFDLHTLGSLGSDWVDISVIAWRELPDPWRGEQE